MTERPPGTLAVLRLLAKTSLLRLLRAARIRRSQRRNRAGARGATQRKRGDGLAVLLVLLLPVFALQSLMVSAGAVDRLATGMHRPVPANAATPSRLAVPEHGVLLLDPFLADAAPTRRAEFANAGALLLLALGAMLLAVAFGGANATLAGESWTLSWLLTFPVPTRSLMLAKALEYSLVQFFPWLMLFPLLLQLLLASGQAGAVWIAVAATLATTFLVGAVRLWLETLLRLRLSLRAVRSLQGASSLLALLLMAAVFRVCLGEATPEWFLAAARAAPAWLCALPVAWPMAIVHGAPAWIAPAVGLSAVVFVAAWLGSTKLLAQGAMRSGGVDPGVRGRAGGWARARAPLGVIGKDLALLRRDRNFLVQTLLVPLFMIGIQLIVNPSLGRVQGRGIALLAYGIGVYSLIGGCFQVLSAEGRALWILYSLPARISAALTQKVRIWAGLGTAFALAAMLAFTLRSGHDVALGPWFFDAVFVAAGVWAAAHIAAAISIIGTDPAADHVPRQPKPRHVYLYLFFVTTYCAGLQSNDWSVRVAGLLVFATLAFALWQRATDRLPWLLDPVDEDRAHIGLYDGGAAVMVFFALQALALLIAVKASGLALTALPLFVAFGLAGVVTVVAFTAMLRLRGVAVLSALGLWPRSWSRVPFALALGALGGALAGGAGLGYLALVHRTGWLALPTVSLPASQRAWLLGLACVAAPLCEEVLFRGLVLQGLLRAVPRALAVVWSAALFMAVHPAAAWPPVFLVGLVTALLFLKTRFLPAAMVAHAVYNLVVVGFGQ